MTVFWMILAVAAVFVAGVVLGYQICAHGYYVERFDPDDW